MSMKSDGMEICTIWQKPLSAAIFFFAWLIMIWKRKIFQKNIPNDIRMKKEIRPEARHNQIQFNHFLQRHIYLLQHIDLILISAAHLLHLN